MALSFNIGLLVHHFGWNWNISATVKWIAREFGTDIYVSYRMYATDCGDPDFGSGFRPLASGFVVLN